VSVSCAFEPRRIALSRAGRFSVSQSLQVDSVTEIVDLAHGSSKGMGESALKRPKKHKREKPRDRDKPRQGVVANTLKSSLNGAVGFID
jgi:hypothetical protein